jgi:hypothetical protein
MHNLGNKGSRCACRVRKVTDLAKTPGASGIVDIRENSYNRPLMLAILESSEGEVLKTLYGITVLWLNGDNMGLTGFERLMREGVLVDYARSWVARLASTEAG